jgi:hypothetical protein
LTILSFQGARSRLHPLHPSLAFQRSIKRYYWR